MTNIQPNPRLVKVLRAAKPSETTTKTVLLDGDVNQALDALKAQVGISKQELVNKLLRYALFTDALSDVLAKEVT